MGTNSDLFRYLILILISNVFLTTARRLFVLHQNTKPLLAFEIVTSLIVIGPLFFYDFANIYTFVAYKVISELALCFLFLSMEQVNMSLFAIRSI